MDLSAYLERIGHEGRVEPSAESLRAMHRAHMLNVPFENLDIHLGREIVLDEQLLYDKVVRQRRGGYCYELNGLFAAMLRQMGFDLDMLSAQVTKGNGEFGPDFDHMTLLVRVDGERWLADVGFGDSFVEPLRLDRRGPQPQDGADYELVLEGGSYLMLRRREGELEQQYRFTLTPRRLADFVEMCRYHQTSPLSHFTRNRVCTRATEVGRITFSGNRLIVTERGQRTEYPLASEEAITAALVEHFGVKLPQAMPA